MGGKLEEMKELLKELNGLTPALIRLVIDHDGEYLVFVGFDVQLSTYSDDITFRSYRKKAVKDYFQGQIDIIHTTNNIGKVE
jgi:hypothetical protein